MEQLDPLDLDPVACYRALKSRDARFDGRLFVGITSTGIYLWAADQAAHG